MKKLKGPPDPTMIAKFTLAWNLTCQYHGQEVADDAGRRFLNRIGRSARPEILPFWSALGRYPPA